MTNCKNQSSIVYKNVFPVFATGAGEQELASDVVTGGANFLWVQNNTAYDVNLLVFEDAAGTTEPVMLSIRSGGSQSIEMPVGSFEVWAENYNPVSSAVLPAGAGGSYKGRGKVDASKNPTGFISVVAYEEAVVIQTSEGNAMSVTGSAVTTDGVTIICQTISKQTIPAGGHVDIVVPRIDGNTPGFLDAVICRVASNQTPIESNLTVSLLSVVNASIVQQDFFFVPEPYSQIDTDLQSNQMERVSAALSVGQYAVHNGVKIRLTNKSGSDITDTFTITAYGLWGTPNVVRVAQNLGTHNVNLANGESYTSAIFSTEGFSKIRIPVSTDKNGAFRIEQGDYLPGTTTFQGISSDYWSSTGASYYETDVVCPYFYYEWTNNSGAATTNFTISSFLLRRG